MKLYRVVILLVGAVVTGIVLYAQVPIRITAPCLVRASAEWHLDSPEPGKYCVEMVSRRPPIGKRRSCLFQFDRADFVRYETGTDVAHGEYVNAGQILGRIRSVENEILLRETLEQIKEAEATLALLKAGSKGDIVEQAQWRVKCAAENQSLAKLVLDRRRSLVEFGLASTEEVEIAESAWHLAGLEAKVAEAELAAAQSGERQEAQEAALHALEGLRQRAKGLSEKAASLNVVAPFRGQVHAWTDTTLILSVFKTDSMAVEIPVMDREISRVRLGQEVVLCASCSPGERFKGRVASIECVQRFIAGYGRVVVTGVFENSCGYLRHDMTGEAVIRCGRVPLRILIREYFSRALRGLR